MHYLNILSNALIQTDSWQTTFSTSAHKHNTNPLQSQKAATNRNIKYKLDVIKKTEMKTVICKGMGTPYTAVSLEYGKIWVY